MYFFLNEILTKNKWAIFPKQILNLLSKILTDETIKSKILEQIPTFRKNSKDELWQIKC